MDANADLLGDIQANVAPSQPLIVATFGFGPIVSQLIHSLLPQADIVASPLWSGIAYRRRGKAYALQALIGEPQFAGQPLSDRSCGT